MPTHGDGSESQPGCDLDGKSTGGWPYDDSKLYQAKSAIIDTISAFGSAEFALATYARVLLGQPCQTDATAQPSPRVHPAWTCPKMPRRRSTVSGTWATPTWNARRARVVRAAPTRPTPMIAFSSGANRRTTPCPTLRALPWGAGHCWVPERGSNYPDIYHWIDGKEDLPPFTAASNREIRAETPTPLAASVYSVRDWLLNAGQTDVGAGAGLLSAIRLHGIRALPAGRIASSWLLTGKIPRWRPQQRPREGCG